MPRLREKGGRSGRQKGLTTVEFAIVGWLLFLLIFTVIDFAIVGFINLTMQHAVREGARYAVTGQTSLDLSEVPSREAAVLAKIRQSSMGFFDSVLDEGDIDVTDTDGNAVSGFGGPGDIIIIRLNCEWPVVNPFIQALLADGKYRFSVAATMRNEFFPTP